MTASTTAAMTGGEALARQLVREGVTDVFAVPGLQLDWAFDGLRQVDDRVRVIVPRHEQATTYMADGYARSTGRVGVSMTVPGPGVLNSLSGLATGYACSSRMLAIAGDIFSRGLGKGHGLLHEVEGQSDILGAVTKWRGRAGAPDEVPAAVRQAMAAILTGRPRPAAIEIAHDVLSDSSDVTLLDPPADERDRGLVRPDAAEIAAAARVLAGARFPVIYAGGGILAAGASAALARLAERLQAPVVVSDHGRGALADTHPLALSTLGGRAVFPHADVVLVAGSRFLEFNQGTPVWPPDGKRHVFVNVEPRDWEPPRVAEACVRADVRLALEALADEVPRAGASRAADVASVRAWVDAQARELAPLPAWTDALRAAIPDRGLLVMDLTLVGYFARLVYEIREPGTFMSPGYQGTLGFGYPAALGAAAADPDRPVVCVCGDGGFGWSLQELATARRYNLSAVAVVFNDSRFGNVRTLMRKQFGQDYASELRNPDFGVLARAFDVPFARSEGPADLERDLGRAIADGGPALIEVPLDELPNPWHLFRLRAPFGGGASPAPPNPLGEPQVPDS